MHHQKHESYKYLLDNHYARKEMSQTQKYAKKKCPKVVKHFIFSPYEYRL